MAIQDGKSQADTREFMVYTDQHGREWEAWGDIKAKLHPATHMTPKFPHEAPWLPDESAMRFNVRNPSTFIIDYDALIAKAKLAHTARYDLTLQVAAHYNVPNFDPTDPEAVTAQMKRELGGGPLPIEPILAAKAGNGFILGLRPYDPTKPGDVKLMAALAAYRMAPKLENEGAEFADEAEYADEVEVVTPKGRRTIAAAGG